MNKSVRSVQTLNVPGPWLSPWASAALFAVAVLSHGGFARKPSVPGGKERPSF